MGRTGNSKQRWLADHRWNQLEAMSGNICIAWLNCTDISLFPELETAPMEHFQPSLNRSAIVGGARSRVTVYFSEEIYKHLSERAD